jgi:hypothetical protein
MSKNKENNLDDLFRQGLLNEEQVFTEDAWENMRRKLEEDDAVILPLDTQKRNNKTIYTMISIATIISAGALMMLGQKENDHQAILRSDASVKPKTEQSETMRKDSEKVSEGGKNQGPVASQSDIEVQSIQTKHTLKALPMNVLTPVAENEMGAGLTEEAAEEVQGAGLYKQVDALQAVVVKLNPIADSTAKSAKKKKDYTFRDGFAGIHFTSQHPISDALKDSNRYNAGFNLQLMSRNLLKTSPFGGYLGVDWGMQFYGKGNKTNVQLNTNNGDSGWTRLSTFSMDFFVRGHVEYARHKLIPYVNFFAGPRFYSTNQKVQSYIPLANSESSDLINATTSVSFMTGVGAGMRLRISDVVSLDARFDWMNGSGVKLTDLDKSSFNGLSYNLVKKSVNPEYYQLKFGVLFNLGYDEEYVPTTTTNNTYREPQYIYTQPTYQYYDSSSKTWINLPMCPCNCDSTGKKINPNNIRRVNPAPPVNNEGGSNKGWEPQPEIRRSGGSGGGSLPTPSGGGKGAFPGIKTGGGGVKVKS